MSDTKNLEIRILLDVKKNLRLFKICTLFVNKYQRLIKDLSYQLPVSELYAVLNKDFKRINKFLISMGLPELFTIILVDYNGKLLKAVKKNLLYNIEFRFHYSHK